jgi:hypothetical protein
VSEKRPNHHAATKNDVMLRLVKKRLSQRQALAMMGAEVLSL